MHHPHTQSVQVELVWVTFDESNREKSSFAYRTAVSEGIKLALDFIPMGLKKKRKKPNES